MFSADHIHICEYEISEVTKPLDIIEFMAGKLAQEEMLDADAIFAAAKEREQVESTAIGRGIAIPHARLSGGARACLCICKCTNNISWGDKTVRLVFLSVAPEENPHAYLQMMSVIMRWRLSVSKEPEDEWIQWPIPILYKSIVSAVS